MNRNHKRLLLAALLLGLTGSAHAAKEMHMHASRNILADAPVPQIEIQVFRDAMDGVNVHVKVKHYELGAPDMVTTAGYQNAEGILQGHAHVFVNTHKVQRLYGPDIHIPASLLQDGVNQVAISLNTHQHENWVNNNHNIMSSVFFDLANEPITLNRFSSQPVTMPHSEAAHAAPQTTGQHAMPE
ncbi:MULTISPECIES: hypothetical protein [unclassified Oceanobacter]|uniref:hypothetical protein n=1 Tax=unclassified Oceanobacter TaxID=2620260 RepID=UPI002733120A|nr:MULTISPECIES: hypothetical protein [unclassified Oceanobacter]MDP2608401.1 hypothetical protein [Oceanobacter sp. 1_MG-2023]MDP2611496.1 hypothetical protein [Oceanobacter sp. 2_MG-2023]